MYKSGGRHISPFGYAIHAGGYEMIVRQVYVYAFYARASPSYADCRRLTDGKVDARTLAA